MDSTNFINEKKLFCFTPQMKSQIGFAWGCVANVFSLINFTVRPPATNDSSYYNKAIGEKWLGNKQSNCVFTFAQEAFMNYENKLSRSLPRQVNKLFQEFQCLQLTMDANKFDNYRPLKPPPIPAPAVYVNNECSLCFSCVGRSVQPKLSLLPLLTPPRQHILILRIIFQKTFSSPEILFSIYSNCLFFAIR